MLNSRTFERKHSELYRVVSREKLVPDKGAASKQQVYTSSESKQSPKASRCQSCKQQLREELKTAKEKNAKLAKEKNDLKQSKKVMAKQVAMLSED